MHAKHDRSDSMLGAKQSSYADGGAGSRSENPTIQNYIVILYCA